MKLSHLLFLCFLALKHNTLFWIILKSSWRTHLSTAVIKVEGPRKYKKFLNLIGVRNIITLHTVLNQIFVFVKLNGF